MESKAGFFGGLTRVVSFFCCNGISTPWNSQPISRWKYWCSRESTFAFSGKVQTFYFLQSRYMFFFWFWGYDLVWKSCGLSKPSGRFVCFFLGGGIYLYVPTSRHPFRVSFFHRALLSHGTEGTAPQWPWNLRQPRQLGDIFFPWPVRWMSSWGPWIYLK